MSTWGDNNDGDQNDNWGSNHRNNDDDDGNSRGSRGGGRGGRGRGGRGGSSRRDDNEDGGWGGGGGGFSSRDGDEDGGRRGGGGGFNRRDGDEDGGRRGRGGFRGGRGGRRDDDEDGGRRERGGGGGWGSNDNDNGENAEDEKPKEIYVPQEPSEDDSVIYGSGVGTGINFDKYESIDVQVTGENAPPPIQSFDAAGLRNIVVDNVVKSGYTKVTPVQKHSIPIIMDGRDLMACAQTGSGKTAAFLLPIISKLLSEPTDLVTGVCQPQCVIVSPTRELAIQIFENARKFARTSTIKAEIIYGGTSVGHQAGKAERGCHILVATPGRLSDFVERGRVVFSSVRFFVLDEADRMLEQGFREKLEEFLDHPSMVAKEQRQTLMFSATFPKEIQHLAAKFLENYLFLTVGILGGACSDVKQNFYEVSRHEKKDKIKELLERDRSSGKVEKTIIFVATKKTADFLAAFLCENKLTATSIHGDRLQSQREQALRDFDVNRIPILVATDVAARGLDIKEVAHVVNYDMPKGIDDYVHRIGRTGRVGNLGKSTTFFDSSADCNLKDDLARILRQANQEVPDCLSDDNRSYAPGSADFGGEDIRNFDSNENGNAVSSAAEPEEEW